METLRDPKLKRKLASEHQSAPPLIDQSTLAGYALLAFSAGLYGVIEYFDLGRDDLTLFFIHYFIALAFVIILIVNKSYGLRKCWRKEHIHKTAILMNLFLVSAYALNRSLPVFEDAVPWLCVYLLLSSAVMMSYLYFNRLPRVVNALQHVLMGSALVLYFYMSVYVANFYVFGTIGIILFGIGAHIFLPLLLLAVAIRLLFITREKRRVSLAWVATGAFLTFGFAVGFMVEWNARVKAIDRLANQSVLHADTDLPVWLKVAATLKNDWITERILKSRLVYSVSNEHFQWDLFPVDGYWDEQRKHDPHSLSCAR